MRTALSTVLAAATAVTLSACGNDQASQDATQALSQFTKAATEMAAGMANNKNAKPVPPVSFKKLIEYLPKGLDGMKTGEPEGQTTSAGPNGVWQISTAKVRFSSEQGGASADAEISDLAHNSLLYIPYQMLKGMKINTESTSGYQRTVEFKGFPAYEEWSTSSKSSELTVLVGDRFVVHTQVNGGEEGAAKQVMDKIDLKDLAKETGS
ncbi:MAG TPA: hypothetical protein VIG08_04580 [Gemmatimonadales bacterium]